MVKEKAFSVCAITEVLHCRRSELTRLSLRNVYIHNFAPEPVLERMHHLQKLRAKEVTFDTSSLPILFAAGGVPQLQEVVIDRCIIFCDGEEFDCSMGESDQEESIVCAKQLTPIASVR